MKDEEPKLEEIETSHTLLEWIGEMLQIRQSGDHTEEYTRWKRNKKKGGTP